MHTFYIGIFSGLLDIPIEHMTSSKARQILDRVDLLSKIREEILSHPHLEERLSLCQPSGDTPGWWQPGKHDKELLLGAAKHGLGRTDITILNDPDFSFHKMLAKSIYGTAQMPKIFEKSEKAIKIENRENILNFDKDEILVKLEKGEGTLKIEKVAMKKDGVTPVEKKLEASSPEKGHVELTLVKTETKVEEILPNNGLTITSVPRAKTPEPEKLEEVVPEPEERMETEAPKTSTNEINIDDKVEKDDAEKEDNLEKEEKEPEAEKKTESEVEPEEAKKDDKEKEEDKEKDAEDKAIESAESEKDKENEAETESEDKEKEDKVAEKESEPETEVIPAKEDSAEADEEEPVAKPSEESSAEVVKVEDEKKEKDEEISEEKKPVEDEPEVKDTTEKMEVSEVEEVKTVEKSEEKSEETSEVKEVEEKQEEKESKETQEEKEEPEKSKEEDSVKEVEEKAPETVKSTEIMEVSAEAEKSEIEAPIQSEPVAESETKVQEPAKETVKEETPQVGDKATSVETETTKATKMEDKCSVQAAELKAMFPDLEVIQPLSRLTQIDTFVLRDKTIDYNEPTVAQLLAHSYQSSVKWPKVMFQETFSSIDNF